MIIGGIPFCSWCDAAMGRHNEALWVIEVRNPDEGVDQRVLGCSVHAIEMFEICDLEPLPPNFSVFRRFMPSDVILHFDSLRVVDRDELEGNLNSDS